MSDKLKIYGTRVPKERGTHREKWYIKKEQHHRYKEIARDKKGRFQITRRWSSKRPIRAVRYTERQPLEIEYKTGPEALEKIRDELEKWRWMDFEAES